MIHVLNGHDNVGVILDKCASGDTVRRSDLESRELLIRDSIPLGHKVALIDIKEGHPVVKYGVPIGTASQQILAGEHVHTHNLAYDRGVEFGLTIKSDSPPFLSVDKHQNDFFWGFPRCDGRAGIRNYIIVVATSNCAASVVKKICNTYPTERLLGQHIDRLVPVTYNHGCALEIGGKGFQLLTRTLAGWVDHPNVCGALLVSLGCESVSGEAILKYISNDSPISKTGCVRTFSIQEVGGYKASIAKGITEIDYLLKKNTTGARVKLPVSQLTVALNCGGSDAFSGLTANPVLGVVSDRLTLLGGSVALAEIPECSGAEHHLISRCRQSTDSPRIQALFHWWSEYVKGLGIELNDNISAGNIEGGITTILEKSLGALAKGGTSEITQVLDYANRITEPGLILMNTPGYDPVSMTGLIAGGCVMGLFTTGRGSLYGCSIAPIVKISSNSTMFQRMSNDMDLNAGVLLEGESREEVAERLYDLTLRVANGNQTASERNGIGDDEFVPWTPHETL